MAGDPHPNASAALECKEKGNSYFQRGDYTNAEAYYVKAINHDPTNPLLHTNRAMALLKQSNWRAVIAASNASIALLAENMKAYYYLAQAQIALNDSKEAVVSAKNAHRYCVKEVESGGKGAGSLGVITELVLRCLKEDWERREDERLQGREGLLAELEEMLGGDEAKIEKLRKVFEAAGQMAPEATRRKMPDWAVDNITFSVMIDPVITKTGQSYDRSSIMEHLKRSPTDPLTREPLRVEELRPNFGLRLACEEFLFENGWAVDW